MDVGPTIGLRSDHHCFRRGFCRAAVDANLIWLSQMDIEDLMRPRRDWPGHHRASQVGASLLKRAHDASKLGTGHCLLDVHKGPSKVKTLYLGDTTDKFSVIFSYWRIASIPGLRRRYRPPMRRRASQTAAAP